MLKINNGNSDVCVLYLQIRECSLQDDLCIKGEMAGMVNICTYV